MFTFKYTESVICEWAQNTRSKNNMLQYMTSTTMFEARPTTHALIQLQ